MLTGKPKWSYRPADINASVSSPPAIVRDLAIAPYGAANPGAVIAVSLSTGKAVWRGADPARNATVVATNDMAYVQTKDGIFLALDAATGQEVWRRAFSKRRVCVSRPVIVDGVVYVTGGMVDKRAKLAHVVGRVHAGAVLVGVTETALVAFGTSSGKTAWELLSMYNLSSPSIAVAGNLLYF